MTDLKPCPFCGEWNMLRYGNYGEHLNYVACHLCKYSAFAEDTADQAIERWNTRPIEDALRAEVETLKRRLAEIDEAATEPLPPGTLDDMLTQLLHDMAHIHLVATGEMDRLTRTDTQEEER